MDRFLTRTDPLLHAAGLLVKGKEKEKEKKKRNEKSWLDWDQDRKRRCVEMFDSQGYKAVQVAFGEKCPPSSTLRGWSSSPQLPQSCGRPTTLSREEEEHVLAAVLKAREIGAIVDSEALVVMALAAARARRGTTEGMVLTLHWAHSFRKRHNLLQTRSITSSRPPCTREDIILDNQWRKVLVN